MAITKVYTRFLLFVCLAFVGLANSGCGIYTFRDVSIDYNKYKTVKINFIENKARFVNPALSPQLTDRLQQKIIQQTKLNRTSADDASMVLSGYISDYAVSTAGVSSQQAATNRLTVSVHIIQRDNILDKTSEYDVSRNFDFSASLSLEQAQAGLQEEILKNITDEIFNRLFSGW